MPGTMSKSDLSSDLKGMLGSSADKFNQNGKSDLDRLLDMAAAALSRDKPESMTDTLVLVAGQADYDVPALYIKAVYSDWGKAERRERKPWQPGYPKQLPSLKTVTTGTGKKLRLVPTPTAAQIADIGADFVYYYTARYQIGSKAIDTTIDESNRDLLLLRAAIAAMNDLSLAFASVPVSMGKGVGTTAKTGTPAVLAESLLREYEAML